MRHYILIRTLWFLTRFPTCQDHDTMIGSYREYWKETKIKVTLEQLSPSGVFHMRSEWQTCECDRCYRTPSWSRQRWKLVGDRHVGLLQSVYGDTNDLSYRQALKVFNMPTLYDRREAICNLMFQEISNNNNHKLYPLLPPPYLGTLRTRKNRKFQVPRFKTNRFRDSFIVSHCW